MRQIVSAVSVRNITRKKTQDVAILIKPGDRLETPIPCPECGNPTEVAIDEWESETGWPKICGYRLLCSAEERESERALAHNELPRWKHLHRLMVWSKALYRTFLWMIENGVRVTR